MSERNFLIPISLFLDFHHYTGNKTLDQRDHYGGLKPDKLVEEEKQVVAFLVPSGLQRRTPPMLCLFGFLKIKFCPHIREQWLPFTVTSWACHGEDRFELHEIWSTNTERRARERLDLRIQNILIPDRKIDAVAKDIKNANAINYVR